MVGTSTVFNSGGLAGARGVCDCDCDCEESSVTAVAAVDNRSRLTGLLLFFSSCFGSEVGVGVGVGVGVLIVLALDVTVSGLQL